MKNKSKIVISFLMALLIGFNTSFCVCASDHGGGGATDTGRDLLKAQESAENRERVESFIKEHFTDAWGFFVYAASQIGCVITGQYKDAYDSWLTMEDILNSDVGIYVDKNNNVDGLYISADLMAQIKALIDKYAKEENTKEENGGFYLLPTTDFSTVPVNYFANAQMFRTFRNIVLEKGCLGVATNFYSKLSFIDRFSDPDHPILLVGNISHLNRYKDNPDAYVSCTFFCANQWIFHKGAIMQFPENDKIYTSCSEASHAINAGASGYTDVARMNAKEADSGNFIFYSTTGERIRVFVSQNAAKNYSVGNRKVYFSENYYNYVPEDLTVSIDDLQKSVDDLQKIIDELLGKIGSDTSEKEIEELLKQILEELRKNPGTGEGGGGGDVNVDIDLSTTNSWLAKIYAKISQIADDFKSFFIFKDAPGINAKYIASLLESIHLELRSLWDEIHKQLTSILGDGTEGSSSWLQESLDEIIEQLKKIKRWTAIDTVVDGVDAIADWLDLIRGVLKDAKEGAGSAVAAIASGVGDSVDLMAKKFPFSIPWDILFFVSALSAEPQVPYFEIPFNIELSALDITIDYTMELDFSQLQWLSDLSRLLLSMTYAVGLMKLTFGVTSVGKEE